MMMNALLISTAAYAVSTFLCVAPVRAEDEEAAAFPSLPLPPEIADFIGLMRRDTTFPRGFLSNRDRRL